MFDGDSFHADSFSADSFFGLDSSAAEVILAAGAFTVLPDNATLVVGSEVLSITPYPESNEITVRS